MPGYRATRVPGRAPSRTSGLASAALIASPPRATASTSAPALADGAFDPVGVAAAALESAHVFSGLPWWATIACGAVGVRLALFPFTLQQAKAGALLNTAIAARAGRRQPAASARSSPPISSDDAPAASITGCGQLPRPAPSSPPSSPFDASPRDRTSVSRLAVRCGSQTSPRWLSTSTPSRRPWGFTARSSPSPPPARSSPTSTTRGEKSPRRVAPPRCSNSPWSGSPSPRS